MGIRSKYLFSITINILIVILIFIYIVNNFVTNNENIQFSNYVKINKELFINIFKGHLLMLDDDEIISKANFIFKDQNIQLLEIAYSYGEQIYINERDANIKYGKLIEEEYIIEELGKIRIVYSNEKHAKNIVMIRRNLIIFGFTLLIFVFFVIFFVSKKVLKPIHKIIDFSEKLVAGDFSEEMNMKTDDEIDHIIKGLNKTTKKLNEVLSNLEKKQKIIKDDISNVSSGNSILIKNVNDQTVLLNTTSDLIDQTGSIIDEKKLLTNEVYEFSKETMERINQAGEKVDKLKISIKLISNSSTKIKKVIEIIENIAFQTKLLALNAAIEAKSSNEFEKGFDLVATEIRSLAQKSVKTMNKVKELIIKNDEITRKGEKKISENHQNIQEVLEDTKMVTKYILEIADSFYEEQRGIEQVKIATRNLKFISDENAELPQNIVVITDKLRKDSKELVSVIEFFENN